MYMVLLAWTSLIVCGSQHSSFVLFLPVARLLYQQHNHPFIAFFDCKPCRENDFKCRATIIFASCDLVLFLSQHYRTTAEYHYCFTGNLSLLYSKSCGHSILLLSIFANGRICVPLPNEPIFLFFDIILMLGRASHFLHPCLLYAVLLSLYSVSSFRSAFVVSPKLTANDQAPAMSHRRIRIRTIAYHENSASHQLFYWLFT